MPFLSALDEQILDRWADGLTQGGIARQFKIKTSRVSSAISRARCMRDPRAARRYDSLRYPLVRTAASVPTPSKYAIRFYRACVPCWSTHEPKTMAVSLPRLKFLEVT